MKSPNVSSRLLICAQGSALSEYALILLLVAAVVFAIVTIFGAAVGNLYSRVTNQVP